MNSFISYKEYCTTSHLNETFESFEELRMLSRKIYNQYKFKQKSVNHFYDLAEFVQSYDEFKIIKDFLKSGVGFITLMILQKMAPGSYVPAYQYEDIFTSVELLQIAKKYKIGVIMINGNHFHYNGIIHELQHAYDDYRSKGKFTQTKLGSRYLKQAKIFTQQNPDEFPTKQKQLNTLYHRTPHELSAYFTNAIDDIEFFDDYGYLRTLSSLYYEFKQRLFGYNVLTDKDKKILARKFTQYYYKTKEKYKKENE